jgi:alpha-L-arabinofuranosidase
MYVVNYGLQSQTRDIKFTGFVPKSESKVTKLGPYPFTARNSGENPDLIKPVIEAMKTEGPGFTYQFPGHSFIVIRMEQK